MPVRLCVQVFVMLDLAQITLLCNAFSTYGFKVIGLRMGVLPAFQKPLAWYIQQLEGEQKDASVSKTAMEVMTSFKKTE